MYVTPGLTAAATQFVSNQPELGGVVRIERISQQRQPVSGMGLISSGVRDLVSRQEDVCRFKCGSRIHLRGELQAGSWGGGWSGAGPNQARTVQCERSLQLPRGG